MCASLWHHEDRKMWERKEQINSMQHGIDKKLNGVEERKFNGFPPNNESLLNATVPSILECMS